MKTGEKFERLLKIMDELREQCPWDKKQTIESLRPLTIEEMYELADAVLENDMKGISEELGDLLLHIAFYTRIGTEQQAFTMDEVLDKICAKLIARHPHIYGDVKVKNDEEVKQNWERLKLKEGRKSVLSGVPNGLPAIVKAWRMQEKAREVGFEWEQKADVWKKVEEEMAEFQEAEASGSKAHMEEEFGDLLFSLINYARFLQIEPESALERTNKKFKSRFMQMEAEALSKHGSLTDLTLQEMDAIWNNIKKKEH